MEYTLEQKKRVFQKSKGESEKIIILLIGLVAFVVILFAVNNGWDKYERAECIRWNAQAVEYPLYTSAQWQLKQCEAVGLPLPR